MIHKTPQNHHKTQIFKRSKGLQPGCQTQPQDRGNMSMVVLGVIWKKWSMGGGKMLGVIYRDKKHHKLWVYGYWKSSGNTSIPLTFHCRGNMLFWAKQIRGIVKGYKPSPLLGLGSSRGGVPAWLQLWHIPYLREYRSEFYTFIYQCLFFGIFWRWKIYSLFKIET